jgi:hypothetical protein
VDPARDPVRRPTTAVIVACVASIALVASLLAAGHPARTPAFTAPIWFGLLVWNFVLMCRRPPRGSRPSGTRRLALAAFLLLVATPWLLMWRQRAHEEACVRMAATRASDVLGRAVPKGLASDLGRFMELRGTGYFRPTTPWDIGDVGLQLVALRTAVFENGTCSAVLVVTPASAEVASTRVHVERRESQIHQVSLHTELSDPLLVVYARTAEFAGRGYWW